MTANEELDILQDRLHNNPSSLVFARLADFFYQKDDFIRALQICEDGLKRNPHYVNGQFVYGKCLLALSRINEAEEAFNRVLLYDPEHLGAHFYLAQILQDRQWGRAYLTRLETLLAIDPLFERAGALLKEAEKKLAGTEFVETEPAPVEEEAPTLLEEKPLAPEAEQPIFGDEDHDIEKLVAEHLEETAEAPVEEAPPVESESASGPETPPEEPAISFEEEGEKEKDFDYILDDIFEDEVLTDKQAEEDIASVVSSSEEPEEESVVEEELEEEISEPEVPTPEAVQEEPASVEEPASLTEEELPVEETRSEAEEIPLEEEPPEQPVQRLAESYDIQEEKKDTAAIVTPTLGEIYAAQGHYAKAIGVYEILLKKDPQNESYREKIAYLKKKLAEESAQNGD